MTHDLYEHLRNDPMETDPALTRRVMQRWQADRAARSRRRRVLAVIGPAAALAAVVTVSAVLVKVHRSASSGDARQAVTTLIRDARVARTFRADNIDRTIDTTAGLFSADLLLALLSPQTDSPVTETTR